MDKKTNAYEESDFVDVVDENDVAQADPIPKQWLGTELAPGLKKADSSSSSKKKDDKPVEIPEGLPTDEWTVPQLTAYAAKQEPPIDLGDAKKKDDILAKVVPTVTPTPNQ